MLKVKTWMLRKWFSPKMIKELESKELSKVFTLEVHTDGTTVGLPFGGQTEKAILLYSTACDSFNRWRIVKVWLPKSALYIDSEDEEYQKEKVQKAIDDLKLTTWEEMIFYKRGCGC